MHLNRTEVNASFLYTYSCICKVPFDVNCDVVKEVAQSKRIYSTRAFPELYPHTKKKQGDESSLVVWGH